MASSQQHKRNENFNIKLNTGNEIIEPIEYENLLGVKIANNFTWNQHVRDDEQSLTKSLNYKISIIKIVSKIASFKTRWYYNVFT